MTTNPAPEAMSIEAFSERYGVCRSIVYKEMRSGRLLFRKLGKRTLIRKADADGWLNALPVGKTAGTEKGERRTNGETQAANCG